jgi:hypothetical protein
MPWAPKWEQQETERDTMVHYKTDNSPYNKIMMMPREIIATKYADTALRALVYTAFNKNKYCILYWRVILTERVVEALSYYTENVD